MKILIISIFPPAKLAEADHAYHLCTQLAAQGNDVHVLAQRGSVLSPHPHVHVNPVMKTWSWREMPRMAAVIRRCRPDAILLNYVGHMYNYHPMVTFAATIAKRIAPGKPFFTMFEHINGAIVGAAAGWRRRGVHKLVRLMSGKESSYPYGTLLRDSDRVVVLSEAHLTVFETSYPAVRKKSLLMPPSAIMMMTSADPVSREDQRQKWGVKPEDTLLVYFGYLYQSKGIETLLAAFEKVCRHRDDIRLTLVGGTVQAVSDPSPGYAQEMKTLAAKLCIQEKVIFTGSFEWDTDHASRFLRAADIAVLPFDLGIHMNNSSLAAVIAHDLPVITTRGESLEGQFVHGQNVFLCPAKDVEQMAAAISTVSEDAELRLTLRAGAKQLSAEWFSLETNIKRLMTAFDEAGPKREQQGRTDPVLSRLN